MNIATGLLLSLILILGGAKGANKDGSYGAIAVSETTRSYAGSRNYPTQAEANEIAIKACGNSDCEVVARFHKGCAVVAMAPDASMSVVSEPGETAATQKALATCGKLRPQCTVRLNICSMGGEKGLQQGKPDFYYGAIAFSKIKRSYAGSRNYPTQAEASDVAINGCDNSDCEVVTSFQNACGAVAMAPDASIAFGADQSEAAAQQKALTACAKYSTRCTLRLSLCSVGGEKGSQQGIAPGVFGAIAFSKSSHRYAGSRNFSSQTEANDAALKECERGDCKIVSWFSVGCAALAMAPDNSWGTDWGADEASAQQKALSSCGKYSSHCTIRLSICSGL